MLYAIFMYPENGYDGDIKRAQDANLQLGARYEVTDVAMGQSSTSIYLANIDGVFNSVQFDFEEDGVSIDIFSDPRYNPYL